MNQCSRFLGKSHCCNGNRGRCMVVRIAIREWRPKHPESEPAKWTLRTCPINSWCLNMTTSHATSSPCHNLQYLQKCTSEISWGQNSKTYKFNALTNCQKKSFMVTTTPYPGKTVMASEDFIVVNLENLMKFYGTTSRLELDICAAATAGCLFERILLRTCTRSCTRVYRYRPW